MSTAEVRQKLRDELATALPEFGPLDPLDQTDDNVFAMFDADGDNDG